MWWTSISRMFGWHTRASVAVVGILHRAPLRVPHHRNRSVVSEANVGERGWMQFKPVEESFFRRDGHPRRMWRKH